MSPEVWKEKRMVESFEADTKGRLRPYVLFSLLINSAWKHASTTGFGYEDLAGRNLMWVLSEFRLSIARVPLWGEEIHIETWGKRMERFYALRDFAVSSPEGESLAAATGAWMILDRQSFRPQRLEQLMASFPWQPAKSALETNLKRIGESAAGQERRRHRVLFSDLDANNHVNAARYLQWIMDSYPRETQEQRELELAEINFLAEAKMDEEVAILFEQRGGQDVYTVRRIRDQRDACRAIIHWKQQGTES
jgi:acyl-ACP thioesterase